MQFKYNSNALAKQSSSFALHGNISRHSWRFLHNNHDSYHRKKSLKENSYYKINKIAGVFKQQICECLRSKNMLEMAFINDHIDHHDPHTSVAERQTFRGQCCACCEAGNIKAFLWLKYKNSREMRIEKPLRNIKNCKFFPDINGNLTLCVSRFARFLN